MTAWQVVIDEPTHPVKYRVEGQHVADYKLVRLSESGKKMSKFSLKTG